MTRFFLIVVLFATVGVCIVLKAAIIMFKESKRECSGGSQQRQYTFHRRETAGKFITRIFLVHGFHGK